MTKRVAVLYNNDNATLKGLAEEFYPEQAKKDGYEIVKSSGVSFKATDLTAEFNHHYTFPFVVYGAIGALWVLWARHGVGRPGQAGAAAVGFAMSIAMQRSWELGLVGLLAAGENGSLAKVGGWSDGQAVRISLFRRVSRNS